MYAVDFEFDGRRLSDFGCILISFAGMTEGSAPSGADIVFSSEKSSFSDLYNIFSSYYNGPYSATFSICKNPCDTESNGLPHLTPLEVSTLQRWLCRRTKCCKFKPLADGYEDLYWNGWFSSQQHMLGGNIVGLDLTFTADAPYAYMEDVELHFETDADESFIVNSVSFEEGYIIPDMTITFQSGGEFTLINDRDQKTMRIQNCSAGEVITISGKYLTIESSDLNHNLALDFNFVFPRIFNTVDETENVFTPNLACNIDIKYTPAFKVGL